MCVTSVHKNLGSLSATAIINIGNNSRLSPDLVKEIYIMLSTTSPSPYLLFDIEGCIRLMIEKGASKLSDCLRLRTLLKTLLKNASTSLEIMDQDDEKVDMTKVVIKVNGLTGGQLYKKLDKKRIDIEKYTQQAIIVTIHTNIQESEVRFLA